MRWRQRLMRVAVLGAMMVLAVGGPHASPTRAAAPRRVTLWLDWYPNTDHVGIYVAMAEGFYARAGLQVEAKVPSGAADAVRLVAHGTGDIGISYEPTVLLARRQGIPVVATAAIVQQPLNSVLTLASSHITRPRQLAGKVVGMAGDASDYTDLKAIVEHDGGNYSTVKPLVVNYSLLQALLTHKADAIIGAYWTWEALQARQEGYRINVLRLNQWGIPPYDELVFVTGQAQLTKEPGVLRAFQRATFQGYAYATAHPAQAVSILLKAPGLLSTSRSLLTQSLALLSPIFQDAHGHYGTMVPSQWQTYANWMTASHLMPGHLNASQALTLSLLP